MALLTTVGAWTLATKVIVGGVALAAGYLGSRVGGGGAGSVPAPGKVDVAGSLEDYAAGMAAAADSLIETETKYITELGETQRKNLGHTLFGKDAAGLRKGLKDAEAMQIRAGEALEKNKGHTRNAFLQTSDGLLFIRGEKQTMLANYKASLPPSQKNTWLAEINSGQDRIDDANQQYREASNEGRRIRGQWQKANPNKNAGDWAESPEGKTVATALNNWKKATDGIKTDENNAIKILQSQIDAAPTVASTPLEQGIEVLEAQINALSDIIKHPEQPLSDKQKVDLQDLRDEVSDVRWEKVQSGFVESSQEALRLADERVALSQEALDSGDPGSIDLLIKASKMMTEASNWQNNAARVQDVNSLTALMPLVVKAYKDANPTTTTLLKESIAFSQAAKKRIEEDTRIPDAASELFDLTYEPSIGRKALSTIAVDIGSRAKRTSYRSAMETLTGKTATERAEEGGPKIGTFTEKQLEKLAKGTLDITEGAVIRGDEAIADKAKELLGLPPTVDTAARGELSNVISKALGLPEGSEASDALEGAVDRLDPTITEALTKAGKDTLTRGPRDVSDPTGRIEAAGTSLIDRAVRGPSEVQADIIDQALLDIDAGVRPASVIEGVLEKASQEGLTAERRPEGAREQALTEQGLDMIRREAPDPSQVQKTMADAAIRDMGAGARGASPLETALGVSGMRGMDAEARGASDIEQALSASSMRGMDADVRAASDVERALGLSAMRGMDAQQRAASPEEAALQARIAELIGGAGTLSPLERRQVEQEMLALQQRQGRARDTGAAAAVTGRMAEARRADLGQDLGLASGLLGQQDALIQARVQEELQRIGMGQQGAFGVSGMEATRYDEMLKQRALAQQGGVSVEQMALDQAQQAIVERQTGAGFLSEAERFEQARVQEELQRQADAQRGAVSASGLESARYEDQLRRQAQGREGGMTAEQITSMRTADELAAIKTGAGAISEAENIRRQAEMDDLARKQVGGEMLTGVQETGLEEESLEQRRKIYLADALKQEQAQEITALGLAANTAEAMALLSNQDFMNSLEAYREGRLAYAQLQQSATGIRAEKRSDIQTSGALTRDLAGVEATKYTQGLEADRSVLFGAGLTEEMRRGRETDLLRGMTTSADIYKTGEGLDLAISGERRADIVTGANLIGAEEARRGSISDDYIRNISAYTGTQPDPASLVLERPSSQTDALSASAQGAGLAGATGFQVTDPNTGLNLSMIDIKNRAQADIAAAANRANITSGIVKGVSTAATAAVLACWVAREVFGIQNPMWLLFRDWMLHTSPSWFRNTYIKYGSRFARFISNKPRIKSLIRKWMTKIVRQNYGI